MQETEVFALIKNSLLAIIQKKDKPVRVAINGIEGTGKTVFAGRLTDYLNTEKMKAIHVSIDGFHFKKAIRYQQGRNSAKGYYEDSYDEMSFVTKVLIASQSDHPHITKAIHDLDSDQALHLAPTPIGNKTVIITDGSYLFKSIYKPYWDLKIYLQTSFEIAMARGIKRDETALGGLSQAKKKFEERYHAASLLYQNENRPDQLADLIVDNSNFDNLEIVKNLL